MCAALPVSSLPNAVPKHSFEPVPRFTASPEPISPRSRREHGRIRKLSLKRSKACSPTHPFSPEESGNEDYASCAPLVFRSAVDGEHHVIYPDSCGRPLRSRSPLPHSYSPAPAHSAPLTVKEHLALIASKQRALIDYTSPLEELSHCGRVAWVPDRTLPPLPTLVPAKCRGDRDNQFSPISPESAASWDSGSSCAGETGCLLPEPSPVSSTFTIASTTAHSDDGETSCNDRFIDCTPTPKPTPVRAVTALPLNKYYVDKALPVVPALTAPHISVIPATPRTPRLHTTSPDRVAVAPWEEMSPTDEPSYPSRAASPSPSVTLSFSRLGLRRMASKTRLFGRKIASASDLHEIPTTSDLRPRETASARTSVDTMLDRSTHTLPSMTRHSADAYTRPSGIHALVDDTDERCSVEIAMLTERGEIRESRYIHEVIPTLRSLKIPSHIRL